MFDGNSVLGFCIVLAIILFTTKLLGLVFRKIGLPQVLGYIIAGIIIGPAIFGDLLGGWAPPKAGIGGGSFFD
ncbi:MAG: hypothetical protein K2H30_06505, partial [Clostridia bacterium]|nr:hypothetical protein [Clostridia bacterium]